MLKHATSRRICNQLIRPFGTPKPVGLLERGSAFRNVVHYTFMPLGIVNPSSGMWYPQCRFQPPPLILVAVLPLSPTHAIIVAAVVVVQALSPVPDLPTKYSSIRP